jgi:hypothetical protein
MRLNVFFPNALLHMLPALLKEQTDAVMKAGVMASPEQILAESMFYIRNVP